MKNQILREQVLRLKQALISGDEKAVLAASTNLDPCPHLPTQKQIDARVGDLAGMIQQPEINSSNGFGHLMITFDWELQNATAATREACARSIFTVFKSLMKFGPKIAIAECVAQSLPIDEVVELFSGALEGSTDEEKYALLDGIVARIRRGPLCLSNESDPVKQFVPLLVRIESGSTSADVKSRSEYALSIIETGWPRLPKFRSSE